MKAPEPSAVPKALTIHGRISLVLQGVIALGLGIALFEGQWFNAAVIGGILIATMLPERIGRRLNVRIPAELEMLAIVFIFASLFLGEIRDYYARYWWWDALLHTGSGFLLGLLGFLLVYVLNRHPRIDFHVRPFFVALFAFSFSVALGSLWEIFEYAMDASFGLNMQKSGLVDTMWDLIVDSLGALTVAVIGYLWLSTGSESFIERLIGRFIASNPQLFERARARRRGGKGTR